jgi:glycosyltransferase involved in cell wall biosynthesis
MTLSVVLNVQSLAPPLTGIGRYTLQILRGLSSNSRINEVRCFSNLNWLSPEKVLKDMLFTEGSVAESKSGLAIRRGSRAGLRRLIRNIPGAYRIHARFRDLAFGYRTKSLAGSVYHEPNYVLRPFPGPSVLTVHDISHLRYPEYHPRERVRYLEQGLPKSLEQATLLITVSEFVKKELIRFLGVEADKITPIALGVDPVYRLRTRKETAGLLGRLDLVHGQYLLVVATLEPRKNLPRLLKAYAQLEPSLRESFPLVLAGAHGWGPNLKSRDFSDLEAKGQIRRLGYVPEQDLPFLYAGAGAFAFPSIYEGFGLPPLEAMASGVPVLTSSAASLPEVVGDTALMVEPGDISQIRDGLCRLLTDQNFRAKASKAGPERASGFTWQRCVEKTIAVYTRAALR